jgi:hypothetical protein
MLLFVQDTRLQYPLPSDIAGAYGTASQLPAGAHLSGVPVVLGPPQPSRPITDGSGLSSPISERQVRCRELIARAQPACLRRGSGGGARRSGAPFCTASTTQYAYLRPHLCGVQCDQRTEHLVMASVDSALYVGVHVDAGTGPNSDWRLSPWSDS